jgi:hypothetical protein
MIDASVMRDPGANAPDRMSSRNTSQTYSENDAGRVARATDDWVAPATDTDAGSITSGADG